MIKVEQFLNNFLKTLNDLERHKYSKKGYKTWNFGSDRELSDRLIGLVLSGKKTATAGLLKDSTIVPKVGDLGIVEDYKGEPRCLVEYIHIDIKPFLEVDYDFAQAEGEGYKDLEEWRDEHRKIFLKWYGDLFTDQSQIVCERFNLLYPIK